MKRNTKFAALILAVLAAVSLLAACSGHDTDYTKVIPEGSFTILSPASGQTDVPASPVIRWTAEPNATVYHLEIFEGDRLVTEYRETGTEKTVAGALKHATAYSLRITAVKTAEETVALARKTVAFTTAAAHATDTPDYSRARTLYDFESYADAAALKADFGMHPAGDTADLTITDEGINGTKAMRIGYTSGVNGWAGVTNSLAGVNKVWSGAKGIAFYVKGSAVGTKLEIRFGKRGYQSWSAELTLNRAEGMYVSIPFTAFADAGGGDGILDLSGITRLWFFLKGARPDAVILDDISIGSDEHYTVDTRAAMELPYAVSPGVFEDFEGYEDDTALERVWGFEGMGNREVLRGAAALEGAGSLGVVPSSSWATVYRTMPYSDFTAIRSIRFRATAGTYVIQLVSGYDVVEKQVTVAVDGDYAGADLTEFAPQNAGMSSDVSRVDRLVIGVKDKNEALVTVDEIVFSDESFVPADYTPKVGMADDFESYTDDAEMERVWKFESMGNYTLTNAGAFEGSKALELSPQAAWATAYRSYPSVDFSAIASIRFRASAGLYVLQLVGADGNVYTAEDLKVRVDGDETGADLAALVPRVGETVDVSAVDRLVIGVKDKSGGVAVIDALSYSDKTFVAPDYDPKAGIADDFEAYTDAAAMGEHWSFGNAAAAVESAAPLSGGQSLRLTTVGPSSWTTAVRGYPDVDFGNVVSITWKASPGVYYVQLIGADNNVYETSFTVRAAEAGGGVNTAELKPRTGDKVDLGSIRQLVIGFNGNPGDARVIDDLTFSDQVFVAPDYTAGMIEDFETIDADELAVLWAKSDSVTLSTETVAPLNGKISLKVASNKTGHITMQKAYFTYDFTNTVGFRFRIDSNHGVKLTVQVGSYGNVYTFDKQIFGDTNNVEEVVVEYDAMTLVSGNSGALDKSKIDYLRIYFTQYYEDYTAVIDDIEFFTADTYTPRRKTVSDFESYADSEALRADWIPNGATVPVLTLEEAAGGKRLKMEMQKGWNNAQYNFKTEAGVVGGESDFQDCYALTMDVECSRAMKFSVKLTRWSVSRTVEISLAEGANRVKIYLNAFTGEADWSDMAFNSLTLGVTDYNDTFAVAVDNIAFLAG